MSRKRNKFLIALIILLVAAIIGTLAYIVVKNLNENNERKSLDSIAGSYASGIENGTTSATEVTSPSINVKRSKIRLISSRFNSRTATFIRGFTFRIQM